MIRIGNNYPSSSSYTLTVTPASRPKCSAGSKSGYSWPQSWAKSYARLSCAAPQTGEAKRYCAFEGGKAVWRDPVLSDCKNPSCPSNVNSGFTWGETVSGQTLTKGCDAGTKTRACTNGQWGAVQNNLCRCRANTASGVDWSQTNQAAQTSEFCPGFAENGVLTR